MRGIDGGMTDAASECSGQEPSACVSGRLRAWGWPGHLLLTSSREWEGNGVSHDARRRETDGRRGSAHPYSDITEVADIRT